MEDIAEPAVLRAIEAMHYRLGEQLTVDDLARAAMFSKFHFTRIFQRTTGVSPGRFLSALRLQRAKELLVSTPMKVADISMAVGYTSVGTFSSRFSRSVGMSPTAYRRRAGFADEIPAGFQGFPGVGATVTCCVRTAVPDDDAPTFVGMFAARLPEGPPSRCAILRGCDQVVFDAPPTGTWYVLAQSVAMDDESSGDRADRPVSVAAAGPFTVRPGAVIAADLYLRPARALDPPVLLALLDARKHALRRLGAAPARPEGRTGASAHPAHLTSRYRPASELAGAVR